MKRGYSLLGKMDSMTMGYILWNERSVPGLGQKRYSTRAERGEGKFIRQPTDGPMADGCRSPGSTPWISELAE